MALGTPPQPADERPNPYLPSGPPPLVFEEWEGVDTQTTRAGVDDKQAYWIDGFMPIKRRRLRTMPGIGSAIFTAGGGLTVIFYKFANLGAIPIAVVVMSDGSVIQVRTDTLAQKTIMTAGTLVSPDQLHVDINQWGSTYILIVSTQPNGYWIWDGTNLFGAGSGGPIITMTNVGAGYSSSPTIVVTGGHGTGMALTANIQNGQVVSVNVQNPGHGYLAGDSVSLTFSGGQTSGSGGTLTAVLTHSSGGSGGTIAIVPGSGFFNGSYWSWTQASVVTGGSGYSSFAVVTVSPSGGVAYVNMQVALTVVGGIITAATVTNNGAYNINSTPNAVVSDAGGYYVSSVTVNSVGSGYSPSTKVTGSGGGSPVAQASYQPVITGGTITSVTVLSGGLYGSNTPPTLAITDSAVTATATIALMPFALQGNTVETYTGHVWIGYGAIKYFSAPGSVTDFATSDGGGNATSNDSFLKVGYTRFIQTNGFLFEVADSSVNYVSGVQTSGSPPTTTYTDQNADPEVGTVWPTTVTSWGNSVLLANSWGVHLLTGSRFTKVNDAMDGVYASVAAQSITPSAAKAIVFNRKIWCLLIQIVDPVTKTQQNKLLIWDNKRWWATLQDVTLTYIAGQEINSVLTAYGTDGTHIYPLFAQPSTAFQKTVQSKLWDTPGSYLLKKEANRFWGLANYNSVSSPNLIVSIDQQNPALSASYTIAGPVATGYFVTPPQAVGQVGELTGMTVQTNAADVELVSVMMDDNIVGYRG
jgi:hypothetical protein